jgi:hypothetical protein
VEAWRAELGGVLSGLTAADRTLYVSQTDRFLLHALNAGDGTTRWVHAAGGRIDSPPTLWLGHVLFGCGDGSIVCLRASDGALVWRFRAGPSYDVLVERGRPASPWPAHGAVLVRDGTLYAVAGRSRFLDGGLRLIRLDPLCGSLLSETLLDRTDAGGVDLHQTLAGQNLPPANNDVLLATDRAVYLRSQPLSFSGEVLPLNLRRPAADQLASERHLLAPGGFLDGEAYHRTYWLLGSVAKGGNTGWYQSARYGPSGRLLAVDGTEVYGYGRLPHQFMWRTANTFHLFRAGASVSKERLQEVQDYIDRDGGKKVGYEGKGFAYSVSRHRSLMDQQPLEKVSAADYRWSQRAPGWHARALVKAAGVLAVGGMPRLADHEAAYEHPDDEEAWEALAADADAWRGQRGGLLVLVDPETGEESYRLPLSAPPVWDGMAAAYGALYLSLTDGAVTCLR